MVNSRRFSFRGGLHGWTWLCLALAFLFSLPALLILFNPLFHAAGLKELASAGDNMASSSDGQKATMASAAAAATAAAGVATGNGPQNSDPDDGTFQPGTGYEPPSNNSGDDEDDGSSDSYNNRWQGSQNTGSTSSGSTSTGNTDSGSQSPVNRPAGNPNRTDMNYNPDDDL